MSLVRSAAVELGPRGLRVNAVAPGMVWTPRVSAYVGEEGRNKNIENTPLRRVALPEDIASALLFHFHKNRKVRIGAVLAFGGSLALLAAS